MKNRTFLTVVISLIVGLVDSANGSPVEITPTKIAFGSCAEDDFPDHPIWDAIVESNPKSMIFMGDNVYLDKKKLVLDSTVDNFKPDYDRLNNTPGFQRLRQIADFHVTWDDNDYGLNDGGGDFVLKDVSQQQFLDFWRISSDSTRYQTPGVYGADWIETHHGRIQVILTDSRYFRSPLSVDQNSSRCPFGDIVPNSDPEATMLGEAQWRWLEERLQQPAYLHILVSSVQVIPEEHCFERWSVMPLQRARLFEAISKSSAYTVLLSGDRHLAEVSVIPQRDSGGVGYDLYEFTSSPLSARSGFGAGEPNRYRAGEDNIRESNFGLMTVQWPERTITVELRDKSGTALQTYSLSLP